MGSNTEVEVSARIAATMRQLKGVDRALADAEHFFEMPGGVRGMMQSRNVAILGALDDHRRELIDLTRSPLLLGSPDCFNAVHETSGKIAYLLDSLHTGPESFSALDERDIQKSIQHARELVSTQIESTLAQVRS